MRDYYQIASGFFLTDQFPEEWVDWSPAEMDTFISDHITEVYEHVLPDEVFELIMDIGQTMETVYMDAMQQSKAEETL